MSKEAVYDERIAPLMVQVLEICKVSKISLIADFGLDDDLHCMSALLADEYDPSESQLKALEYLKAKPTISFGLRISTPRGKS